MAEISPLRRRMIEDMAVRNLSPATQQSYLNAVSKFSRYFGRSPDRLDLEDVHAFQVHLVATGISWPALNQIVCALRFFYGVTLGQDTVPERIAYAREPSKLPVVLSADEVVRFLEAIPSLKSRTALTTVYAAGLCEVGWPIGLKWTQEPGWTVLGTAMAVISLVISGGLLFLAQRDISLGTSYAVWTGIGAAGTFLVGVWFFGDPSSFGRWLGASLIIAGVITLKLAH